MILLSIRTKYILPTLFTLLTAAHIPSALGDSFLVLQPIGLPMPQDEDNGKNPHESRQKFERYVKGKYKEKEIRNAESDVKQTPHGPSGKIWISGEIAPQKRVEIDLSKEKDRHVRARAIAKAFIEDEPVLLGNTNPDEILESNISTDNGFGGEYTHIKYKRYINDIELDNAFLHIVIGPNEKIFTLRARLVPVPPEVYEATKKETLSEEEIKSIIEADLTEADKRGYDMNTIYKSFKKVAITKPPYVEWEVQYIYMYVIDPFTGKILSKISPIIKEPTLPKADSNKLQPTTVPVLTGR